MEFTRKIVKNKIKEYFWYFLDYKTEIIDEKEGDLRDDEII